MLRPVQAPRVTVKDTRQPVSINFAHRVGRQEQELELATGKWELEWQGYDKLEYFQVAGGEEFELGLITISGSCEKKQQQCLLIPDSSARRVVIPEKQR